MTDPKQSFDERNRGIVESVLAEFSRAATKLTPEVEPATTYSLLARSSDLQQSASRTEE